MNIYYSIMALSLLITAFDIGYTIIIADLITILQGSKEEAITSKLEIFTDSDHIVYFLGALLILRFIISDFVYLKINKKIYLIYCRKIKDSLKKRLENISSAEIFDEPGRAVKNYNSDINIFIGGFLAPLIQLSIDIMVITGLTFYASLYLSFEFWSTLTFLLTVFILVFLMRLMSEKSKKLGKERNDVDSLKAKILSDLSGTWRSLVDLQAQNYYIQKVNYLNEKYSSISINISRYVNLTKLSIETYLGMILVGSCILVAGNLEYSAASSAVAIAVLLRVFPTINRSAQSIMSIQSSIGALESFRSNSPKQTIRSRAIIDEDDNFLNIHNMEIHNTHEHILALRDISISKNNLTVVSAPSGAGKTLFLKSLYFELKKNSKKVAYLPQNYCLLSVPVIENIYLRDDQGEKKIASELLERVGFSTTKASEILRDARLVSSLSGGEVQRVFLARYLTRNLDYLLMDEVTSALDHATELQIMGLLKSLSSDCTIIINSHSNFPDGNNINKLLLEKYIK